MLARYPCNSELALRVRSQTQAIKAFSRARGLEIRIWFTKTSSVLGPERTFDAIQPAQHFVQVTNQLANTMETTGKSSETLKNALEVRQ